MENKINLVAGAAPADTALEREMVGTLMVRPSAYEEVKELLTPESFEDYRNRDIWEAIVAINGRGKEADMRLVIDELARGGKKTDLAYVVETCTSGLIAGDLPPHAVILRDLGLRRLMWETGLRLMSKAGDMAQPIEETHAEARKAMDEAFSRDEEKITTLADNYARLQQQILLNMNRAEGEIAGTPTGFEKIDGNGGLCGSDLIIVGAETSQGKTSFATALTLSAIQHGESVAFYSMEMTPLQLTARISAMQTGIRASQLLFGKIEMDDLKRMDAIMGGVNMGNMYFDGSSTSSLERIVMSIRGLKHKWGISGAVVDYLQLVNSGDRGLSPEQRAAKCARELKNLAKELGIWIIAISQLRRDPQSSEPSMSRLRDSGQIEEAADNIYLIYRPRDGKRYPAPFADWATEGTAMVKIAKGRNVGTDAFICGFRPETTCFYELSEAERLRKSNTFYVEQTGETLNNRRQDPTFGGLPF